MIADSKPMLVRIVTTDHTHVIGYTWIDGRWFPSFETTAAGIVEAVSSFRSFMTSCRRLKDCIRSRSLP